MSVIGQNGQCRRFYTYGIIFGSDFRYNNNKRSVFCKREESKCQKVHRLSSVSLVIVAAGVYAFGVAKLPLTFSGVIVLVLLLWTLLDWRRVRQIYHAKQAAGDGKAS